MRHLSTLKVKAKFFPKRRDLSKFHGVTTQTSVRLGHTRKNLTSSEEVDLEVNTEKNNSLHIGLEVFTPVVMKRPVF
jgi:hypothetical protein